MSCVFTSVPLLLCKSSTHQAPSITKNLAWRREAPDWTGSTKSQDSSRPTKISLLEKVEKSVIGVVFAVLRSCDIRGESVRGICEKISDLLENL